MRAGRLGPWIVAPINVHASRRKAKCGGLGAFFAGTLWFAASLPVAAQDYDSVWIETMGIAMSRVVTAPTGAYAAMIEYRCGIATFQIDQRITFRQMLPRRLWAPGGRSRYGELPVDGSRSQG